jgi:hypothetical protein
VSRQGRERDLNLKSQIQDFRLSVKKIGDAAWEDCVALCPVTVLTTVTENREQEVMLSSPVSLAPLSLEQSRCHIKIGTHFGYDVQHFSKLMRFQA